MLEQFRLKTIKDADFYYVPNFFDEFVSASYFEWLRKNVEWEQKTVKFSTVTNQLPRMTSWFGDKPYFYSGIMNPPKPMPPIIDGIKAAIENFAGSGYTFNSVLLNLYRHNNDSVSAHRDNEKGMGENPNVASISLGADRLFRLKNMETSATIDLLLENGSLLLMGNQTQIKYCHSIPKLKTFCVERINLTFRRML